MIEVHMPVPEEPRLDLVTILVLVKYARIVRDDSSWETYPRHQLCRSVEEERRTLGMGYTIRIMRVEVFMTMRKKWACARCGFLTNSHHVSCSVDMTKIFSLVLTNGVHAKRDEYMRERYGLSCMRCLQ